MDTGGRDEPQGVGEKGREFWGLEEAGGGSSMLDLAGGGGSWHNEGEAAKTLSGQAGVGRPDGTPPTPRDL